MSIFSKIKSAVYSTAYKVGAAVSKAASSLGSSLSASTISAVNTLKSGGAGNFPSAGKSPLEFYQVQKDGSALGKGGVDRNTGQPIANTNIILGGPNGTTYYNAQGGGNSAYNQAVNSYGGQAPVPTPVTIGAGQNRTTSTTTPSSLSGSTPISGASLESTPSISYPSSPNHASVSQVNSAGLATGGLQYDTTTGLVTSSSKAQTPEQIAKVEADKKKQDLAERIGLIPKSQPIGDNPEVQAQNVLVKQQQQELNNLTSQLNNVVAKQQVDLLNLRKIGSQEGVTETVYGNQERAINYDAAVKALPLQAQIATAQGNVKLAQDYLTELRKYKQDQLDSDYKYTMDVYNATKDFLDKRDKAQLDKMEKVETRAYSNATKNHNDAVDLAQYASQNGAGNLIDPIMALDINSPNFAQNYGRFLRQITPKASGVTGENLKQTINKQIASDKAFQSATPEDQAMYIRSLGGNPYDFGY